MAGKLSSKIQKAATDLRKGQNMAPAGTATEQAFQGAAAAQGQQATTPSGQSNISETLGVQDARSQGEAAAQALENQAGQAQVQEAQQESAQRQRDAAMTAQRLEADTNYNNQINNQLARYKENSLDMDAAEEELALEDLGAKLALKDKQYQAELGRRGEAARLRDANAFTQEVKKQVMGEELANFRDQLEFAEREQGMDLESMEALAAIDINSAMAAANAALQSQLSAQQSAGFSQLGQAAGSIIGGMDFGGGSSSTPTTTSPTNTGSTGKLGGPV